MSGIYIPGMKTPESCSECLNIGWNYVFECQLDDAEEGQRLPSCPLIEVLDGALYKLTSTTNADRIRSSSDEKLAILCEDGCPPGAPICNSVETIEGETTKEHCQRCWLSWLKSPADKEGEG